MEEGPQSSIILNEDSSIPTWQQKIKSYFPLFKTFFPESKNIPYTIRKRYSEEIKIEFNTNPEQLFRKLQKQRCTLRKQYEVKDLELSQTMSLLTIANDFDANALWELANAGNISQAIEKIGCNIDDEPFIEQRATILAIAINSGFLTQVIDYAHDHYLSNYELQFAKVLALGFATTSGNFLLGEQLLKDIETYQEHDLYFPLHNSSCETLGSLQETTIQRFYSTFSKEKQADDTHHSHKHGLN